MGKIDHAQNAIDQGIANGDQGIYASQDEARDDETGPSVRSVSGVAEEHNVKSTKKVSGEYNPNNTLNDFVGGNPPGGRFYIGHGPSPQYWSEQPVSCIYSILVCEDTLT